MYVSVCIFEGFTPSLLHSQGVHGSTLEGLTTKLPSKSLPTSDLSFTFKLIYELFKYYSFLRKIPCLFHNKMTKCSYVSGIMFVHFILELHKRLNVTCKLFCFSQITFCIFYGKSEKSAVAPIQ